MKKKKKKKEKKLSCAFHKKTRKTVQQANTLEEKINEFCMCCGTNTVIKYLQYTMSAKYAEWLCHSGIRSVKEE